MDELTGQNVNSPPINHIDCCRSDINKGAKQGYLLAYRLKAETIQYAHMYEGENDKGSLTWIVRCNLTEDN